MQKKTLATNFRAKKSELTSGLLMSSFDFFFVIVSFGIKGIEATVAQNDKSRDNNVQMRCLLRSNANLMNAIHLIVAAQAALLTQLFQRRFRP